MPVTLSSRTVISASFTRPDDTTQYTAADLIANSTVAGDVVPMSFAKKARAGKVVNVRLSKDDDTVTDATFRLHLYSSSPTCTNGDNGAWLTTESGYLGSVDLDMSAGSGRTFAAGAGVFVEVAAGIVTGNGGTLYALVEALDSYTPSAEEVFTVTLGIED